MATIILTMIIIYILNVALDLIFRDKTIHESLTYYYNWFAAILIPILQGIFHLGIIKTILILVSVSLVYDVFFDKGLKK